MNTSTCPNCHQPLPAEAPQGLCPACLMDSVMHDPPPADAPTAEDLAALAKHFPLLVIEELIGTGGMGRVYRAQQPHLNRTVALKVLTPERANDPEWLERFNREARALARLSHPHIVQVYDFGEAPMPFLLMEYVDGVNLRQAMQNGALTAREALAIVPKLCDALHYAHEHGVLHRDIKPENILIDTEGRVKVVDFGLAKLRDEKALPFTLTESGAKLGTLAYMAPEQIEKPSDVDHRADIYSLGVVFYEMLTGELPLGRFPTPSEASGVDPRLDSVVMRTLEKRREKRFDNANEMKSGIENASTSAPPAAEMPRWDTIGYEYRSKASIGSWPLLHIAFNKDPLTSKAKRARGIIAVGMHARGVVALGLFSYGLFAWGVVSFGLIASGVVCLGVFSSGVLSIALAAAHGVIAIAPVALGVTCLGYISAGVVAVGKHVAGVSGPIDPLAAQIGDRWLVPTMRWSNGINAIALSMMMLLGAFGSWKARKHWGHIALFVALSLIGPFNYLTTRAAPSQMQSFASRLQRMEQEKAQTGKAASPRTEMGTQSVAFYELCEGLDRPRPASSLTPSKLRDQAFRSILDATPIQRPGTGRCRPHCRHAGPAQVERGQDQAYATPSVPISSSDSATDTFPGRQRPPDDQLLGSPPMRSASSPWCPTRGKMNSEALASALSVLSQAETSPASYSAPMLFSAGTWHGHRQGEGARRQQRLR
jgi:serine/threonine protein kinase